MNAIEILATCEKVRLAPDYESAWQAWAPLLKADLQQAGPDVYSEVVKAYFSMVYTKKRKLGQGGAMALAEAQCPIVSQVFFEGVERAGARRTAQAEQEFVERLKMCVIEFIRWSTEDDYDPADLDAVQNAPDFASVQAVLARYDDPALSFLDLVRAGYFV